jgi:hypothetical protein
MGPLQTTGASFSGSMKAMERTFRLEEKGTGRIP